MPGGLPGGGMGAFGFDWYIILTNFEMLSRRSESFAQRNFYGNLEIIFIRINQQKLNPFEGLAHGEKLFCLRGTFKEVKCMSSK